MLKILHTADWHIGQNFFDYSRKNEHLIFFYWLKNVIQEENIDLLLIAGDIFDSPNPSAESQKMYYSFLYEVTKENPSLQIIIIAGNHDSAARLEAPNPLLEAMNITVKGVVKRTLNKEIDFQDLLVPIKKNEIIVAWCIAVPFLRQGDYPDSDEYSKGVVAMYDALYSELCKTRRPEQAIIAMGHLHAKGAEISKDDKSERTIGGLDAISPELFESKDILYTAFGHLHQVQHVFDNERIQYSGSPLPMSFAEKNYTQGVNLIEIDRNALLNVTQLVFDCPVKLLSIPKEPKTLIDVLEEIRKLPDGEVNDHSPFIEIRVLVTEPEPSMRFQLEEALKGKAVRLTHFVQTTPNVKKVEKAISLEELQTMDPLEMALDVFRNQYDNDMPEELTTLLQSVIREVTP